MGFVRKILCDITMAICNIFTNKRNNKMSQDALKFLGSPRGQYIVGQALAIAVAELEKVEPALQEKSNIQDMQFLGEQLFKAGYATHTMLSQDLLNKIKEQVGNDPDKLIEDEELVREINDQIKRKMKDGEEEE